VSLGGITVFAARRVSAFRPVESALIETSVACDDAAHGDGRRNPNLYFAQTDRAKRYRRAFATPLLIGRDFSGLTLTSGKP
jgi:hypothetical protein